MYSADLKLVDQTHTPHPYTSFTLDNSLTNAKLLEIMNRTRAKYNLTPLKSHSKLAIAADTHATDMANNNTLSHFGITDHTTWADRCKHAGYPGASLATIGETVAAGYTSCEDTVNAWMQSPGHRVILLSTQFQHVGSASRLSSKGYIYWASDFGCGAPDEVAPPPAPSPEPTPAPPDNMLIT